MGDGFAGRAELVIEAVEVEAAGRSAAVPLHPAACWPRAASKAWPWAWSAATAARPSATCLPEADQLPAFLPRERAPKPKPHPDQLWDACRQMGLDPGQRGHGGRPPHGHAGCGGGGVPGGGGHQRPGGREELKEAGAAVVLAGRGRGARGD